MQPRILLVSVACLSLFSVVPANTAEGEGTSSEAASSESKSLCGLQQQALYSKLEHEVYEEYNISINCLQFDSKAELERAIVSAFGETEGKRDVIECRGGVLVATPSPGAPDRFDIRDSNHTGCLTCNDNATGVEICDEPCDRTCERCYSEPDMCTRCIACLNPSYEVCESASSTAKVCREECNPNQEPNSNLYNTCECQEGYYKLYDTYLPIGPGPNPSLEEQEELAHCEGSVEKEARPFMCTTDCSRMGALVNFAVNEESHICFACGLEDCFRCENPDDHPECTQCIAERVLFEGECFSCPRREIAFLAVEQEHEIEEEERKKEITSIELAVSLPIVCIIVILFFVLTSVFAHYRYPHISHHGHKRHRKPNEPQPPQEGPASDDDEDRQLESSQVWRARPTIRLR